MISSSTERSDCEWSWLQVMDFIEENMPPESATAYGLHTNAEVGFKRREAERFCMSLMLLQPREAAQDGGLRPEERAKLVLDDIMERLPEVPKMDEVRSRVDEPTPYTMVALQVQLLATLIQCATSVHNALQVYIGASYSSRMCWLVCQRFSFLSQAAIA